MPMSRLRTDRQTDGNVKVEQYSAEAESAICRVELSYDSLGFASSSNLATNDQSAGGGGESGQVNTSKF